MADIAAGLKKAEKSGEQFAGSAPTTPDRAAVPVQRDSSVEAPSPSIAVSPANLDVSARARELAQMVLAETVQPEISGEQTAEQEESAPRAKGAVTEPSKQFKYGQIYFVRLLSTCTARGL